MNFIRYPIGNNAAAEYYIANFIYFYSLTNKLVSDDIDKDKEKSYSVVYQPDPTNKNGIQSIPTSMLASMHQQQQQQLNNKSSINLNSPQAMYSNLSSVSNSSSYQYSPHVAKKAKIQGNSKLSSTTKSNQTVAGPLPNTVNPMTFSPVNNPVQSPPNPATSLQQKLQQPQLQQAQLQQAQLQQPQLQQAQLQQAQLQQTQLQQAQLQQAHIQAAQLQKLQMQQVQLQQQIQQTQVQLAQLQNPQPQLTQPQLVQLQTQLTQKLQIQKLQYQKLQQQQQLLQQSPILQRVQQLQKEKAAQVAKATQAALESKTQVQPPVQAQATPNAQVQQIQLQTQSTPPLKATPTIQNKPLPTVAAAPAKTNITPSIPTKPLTATAAATISTPQIPQQSPVNKVTQKIPTAASTVANRIPVTQSTPLMKTPSHPPQALPQQQAQQTTPLLSSQNRIKTTPNIPYKSSPPLNLRQPNTAAAAAATMNKYYPEGFNANAAAAAQAKIISGSPPTMVIIYTYNIL